ncbi:hypothetical protein EBZ35_04185 [bacterium]|nr:hypothetical protein [bacterium]
MRYFGSMASIRYWIDFFHYMLRYPVRRLVRAMTGLCVPHIMVGVLILLGITHSGWAQVLQSEWSVANTTANDGTSSQFLTRFNVANFFRVYTRPNMHMGNTAFGVTNQIQGKVVMGPEPNTGSQTLHQVAQGVLNLSVPMALQKDTASFTHLVGSVRVLDGVAGKNNWFIRPKEMIQQNIGIATTNGVYANLFVLTNDVISQPQSLRTLDICLDTESLADPTPFVMTIIQENTQGSQYLTRTVTIFKECIGGSRDDSSSAKILPEYQVMWPGQHLGDGPLVSGHTIYTLFFVPSGKPGEPKYYILGDVIKGLK